MLRSWLLRPTKDARPGGFTCHGPASTVKLDPIITKEHKGLYYFAYGSNMDWPQMRQRCPTARFAYVARLPDYRFAIVRHSRLRNCGTANIFLETGREV